MLLDGQMFLEGPRWHDGKLWFSDMHAHQVKTVDLNGHSEVIAEVAAWPSGLGWLADGRLLIVSMTDRKLLRRDPDGLKVHADLSKLASFHCNDMVSDTKGRAYVGNFGYNLLADAAEEAGRTGSGESRRIGERRSGRTGFPEWHGDHRRRQDADRRGIDGRAADRVHGQR